MPLVCTQATARAHTHMPTLHPCLGTFEPEFGAPPRAPRVQIHRRRRLPRHHGHLRRVRWPLRGHAPRGRGAPQVGDRVRGACGGSLQTEQPRRDHLCRQLQRHPGRRHAQGGLRGRLRSLRLVHGGGRRDGEIHFCLAPCARRRRVPLRRPPLPGLLRHEPVQQGQLVDGAKLDGHVVPLVLRLLPAALFPFGKCAQLRVAQQILHLPPDAPVVARDGVQRPVWRPQRGQLWCVPVAQAHVHLGRRAGRRAAGLAGAAPRVQIAAADHQPARRGGLHRGAADGGRAGAVGHGARRDRRPPPCLQRRGRRGAPVRGAGAVGVPAGHSGGQRRAVRPRVQGGRGGERGRREGRGCARARRERTATHTPPHTPPLRFRP